MDPITIGLLAVSAIPSLFKMGKGFSDKKKAKQLESTYNLKNAPQAEIPSSFKDYMALRERMANGNMPTLGLEQDQINASTAQALSGVRQTASNESSAMAGLLGTIGQQRTSLRDLGIRALQWKSQQQENLSNAYLRGSEEQKRLFEYNKWLPWQMGMNQAASYRNAGRQELTSGLDSIGALGVQAAGIYNQNQQYDKMINAMYGTGANTTVAPPMTWPAQFQNTMNGAASNQNNAAGYNLGFDPYSTGYTNPFRG